MAERKSHPRDFPGADTVSPRQRVTAMGKAVRGELSQRFGREPSDALVEDCVRTAWRDGNLRTQLNKKAYGIIDKELEEILGASQAMGGTEKIVRKRARAQLQRKYQALEGSYGFLDKILLGKI